MLRRKTDKSKARKQSTTLQQTLFPRASVQCLKLVTNLSHRNISKLVYYLGGMRDRSMRSGTELAREIQITDWSTAGEQGKLVFVVTTTPSLSQFISLFTTGKKSSLDRPSYASIEVFHFMICVKKKGKKEIRFD